MSKKMVRYHPGTLLKEELDERGLSMRALARSLHVPVTRISAIVQGNRGISADTSARLGRFFGASPEFWLRIQMGYDMRQVDRKRIESEVKTEAA